MIEKIKKLKKIPRIIQHNYFYHLQKFGLANYFINKHIHALGEDEILSELKKNKVFISPEDYENALNCEILKSYKTNIWKPHTKILEYLTSELILKPENGDTLLDAAGGYESEFARYICDKKNITVYCQDANKIKNPHSDIQNFKFIRGSVDKIPLPEKSIDLITCHHSFEHFEGDLDIKFIKECTRLLSKKGKLLITPIFLTNNYCEITNLFSKKKYYDPDAKFFYDPTASFPGWGDFQGFARTYDNEAFQKRILKNISGEFIVEIYSVFFENEPAPKFNYAYYQPKLNMNMKALLIKRK